MKTLAKISLIFSLFLICMTTGWPQEIKQTLPPNPKFKHHRKITQIYDPSSDQTRVLLEKINIHAASSSDIEPVLGIDMGVLFTFPGKTVARPEEVKLGFFLHTSIVTSKYQVTVKADNEVLVKDSYPITSKQKFGRVGYLIDLEFLISYEKFQRMVNAKKVKVKVSGIENDLSKEDMESLRDFASRMQP